MHSSVWEPFERYCSCPFLIESLVERLVTKEEIGSLLFYYLAAMDNSLNFYEFWPLHPNICEY